MEKSNKRGKIPQADWPLIMARYEAGETLASIARTYDCSPPAISYVVSKSRARHPFPDRSVAGTSGPEAQLIKGMASEPAHSSLTRPTRLDVPRLGIAGLDTPAAHHGGERRAETMSTGSDTAAGPAAPPAGVTDGFLRDGVVEHGPRRAHAIAPAPAIPPAQAHPRPLLGEAGAEAARPEAARPEAARPEAARPEAARNERPAPAGSGTRAAGSPALSRNGADARHKLHLSLGNGSLGNGASSYDASDGALFPASARSAAEDGRPAPGHAATGHDAAPAAFGASDRLSPHSGREAGFDAASRNKDGAGSFIDQQLRARVDTDIAVFLAAFDAALTQDTQENRSALREATDRLLRAGARTRIELERLEARLPLTAHDNGRSDPGAWRYR